MESHQRGLTIQKCCADFPLVVPDATESGLTVFDRLKVNISSLEVPGCWPSITRKDVGCVDADEGLDGCCTLAITVAGCVVAI